MFRMQDLGFRLKDLGFRIQGVESRSWVVVGYCFEWVFSLRLQGTK